MVVRVIFVLVVTASAFFLRPFHAEPGLRPRGAGLGVLVVLFEWRLERSA